MCVCLGEEGWRKMWGWGAEERKRFKPLFSCLLTRFNDIFEMEKANDESFMHLVEGRSVSQ